MQPLLRLIINGKGAADNQLRQSVESLRSQGCKIDVRVTWEPGDATRYAAEAALDNVPRVVAVGGDGTVNEVVNGLMSLAEPTDSALAVIPFGTANDFAKGINVPLEDPMLALQSAVQSPIFPIDVGLVHQSYFVNIVSGGFGAEITAQTPPQMKKILGGAAYSLMGWMRVLETNAWDMHIKTDDVSYKDRFTLVAVCNASKAGGGYEMAPAAKLDDGLLDLLVIKEFGLGDMPQVASEFNQENEEPAQFVFRHHAKWIKIECQDEMNFNLDGEPVEARTLEFELAKAKLNLVTPDDCPLVQNR